MGIFDQPGLAWMLAGVGLGVAELVLPGMYLLWLGLAAFGTGLLQLVIPMGLGGQVFDFGGLALFSVLTAVRRRKPAAKTEVNQQGSGLIGRRATALVFTGSEGRVRVGDSDWPARLEGGGTVDPGTMLKVENVDGMTLLVHRLGEAEMTEG